MSHLIGTIKTKLDANLGRCPRCMRQAFLATLGAWFLAGALGPFAARDITGLAMGLAVSLTLLWLAHLGAYALRAARVTNDRPVESRRRFAANLLKAAGAMAAITALSGTALADGCCDCSKCRTDQVCCKTANGCCGCFPQGIQC
jgi:hypothetical protein